MCKCFCLLIGFSNSFYKSGQTTCFVFSRYRLTKEALPCQSEGARKRFPEDNDAYGSLSVWWVDGLAATTDLLLLSLLLLI